MCPKRWSSSVAWLIAGVFLGTLGCETNETSPREMVEICHVPPGDPDNPQTLLVDANTVDEYLRNNPDDRLGPCDEACMCDDENPCTSDTCDDAGECVFAPKECEDGNICTKNDCDSSTGECTSVADMEGVSCDDGVLCTSGDTCTNGECVGESIEDCCRNDADCETDGTFCTVDTCDMETGNCSQEDFACPGDACAPAFCVDTPQGPTCEATPVVCEDPDPCIAGSCRVTPSGGAECAFGPVAGCQNCEFEWLETDECGEDAMRTETLFIDQLPLGDGAVCPGDDGDTRTTSCCMCRDKSVPLVCGP